jgi:hypothetical protein
MRFANNDSNQSVSPVFRRSAMPLSHFKKKTGVGNGNIALIWRSIFVGTGIAA